MLSTPNARLGEYAWAGPGRGPAGSGQNL